jgi:hypothetical protein
VTQLILWFLSLLMFPQAPATPPLTVAKASPEIQARILRTQLQAARLQSAFQACQAQDFQGHSNKLSVDMQEAINDAFKAAKLDKKDWELNMETFEFQRKVAAPAPSAPPPATKP